SSGFWTLPVLWCAGWSRGLPFRDQTLQAWWLARRIRCAARASPAPAIAGQEGVSSEILSHVRQFGALPRRTESSDVESFRRCLRSSETGTIESAAAYHAAAVARTCCDAGVAHQAAVLARGRPGRVV